MGSFRLTTFRSYKEPVYAAYDATWAEFVELVLGGHTELADKHSSWAFNATRFKTLDQVRTELGNDSINQVRRTKANAMSVEMLIIDYDNMMTLDAARDRFKDFEYVGYTSYRHLEDPTIHKFRLIFPLTAPIPAHTHYDANGREIDHGVFFDLTDAMSEFAPGLDPATFNAIQPFFPPTAPAERIHLAETWHNTGKILDWTQWQVNQRSVVSSGSSAAPLKYDGSRNQLLDPDQEFQHAKGSVVARDVIGRIQKVTCPFHTDTSGSEFLVRHDSGVISFTCKHCGTFSLPPTNEEPAPEYHGELVEMDKVWWDHTDRTQVSDFLAKTKRQILDDSGRTKVPAKQLIRPKRIFSFKSHILYLPEGSGKSQLALSFLADPPDHYFKGSDDKHRHQIIFACKSWNQVLEQHATFLPKVKAMGRTAKIAWSFDGRIERRFKVKVRRSASGPFRPGGIHAEETIDEIIQTNPHLSERFVRLAWSFLISDDVRFYQMAIPDVISVESDDQASDDFFEDIGQDPPAIIFTTFAQLRLLRSKHDRIPKNWIIWIDDPDLDDALDIKPITDGRSSNSKCETYEINGTRYYRREEQHSLCLPLANHRCIYTTTEKVTTRLLKHLFKKRREPYQIHGDRHPVTGGNITILGTQTVQKRYDAIIPLLVRRLNKEKHPNLLLIADGIPAAFNHSTNKGRNDLKKNNIIVEVSYPHPVQVKTVCDALGVDFKSGGDEISKELMLDKMHQAIGRNSGFRAEGFECVVLVDKARHEYLVKECGYQIVTANSVMIDRTARMSRKDTRTTETASPLVKELEQLLNNPHDYLANHRKVKSDIEFVISTLTDPDAKIAYIRRLLVALTSFAKVNFTEIAPKDHQSKKVWVLGQWLLDTMVPSHRRKSVLASYLEDISAKKPS